MANTPFKLRSGNTPLFKTMGSSPAYATEPTDGVPRKKQSVVSEDYKKTYNTGPVKGPEDSDVMNIIKKRKQSGPQDSEYNKQKEIDELVEKRDPNAGKRKIKKTKKKSKKKYYVNRDGERVEKDKETKAKRKSKEEKSFVDKVEDGDVTVDGKNVHEINKEKRDNKTIKKRVFDKVTDKVRNIYDKVTSEESVNKRKKKKIKREKKEKEFLDKSRERLENPTSIFKNR